MNQDWNNRKEYIVKIETAWLNQLTAQLNEDQRTYLKYGCYLTFLFEAVARYLFSSYNLSLKSIKTKTKTKTKPHSTCKIKLRIPYGKMTPQTSGFQTYLEQKKIYFFY